MEIEKYSNAMAYFDKKVDETGKDPKLANGYGSKAARILRYFTAERLPFFDVDKWNGKTVLDLGCGTGEFCDYLISKNHDVEKYLGIDPNKNLILIANSNAERMTVTEKYRFRNADIFDVDDKFDYIVANGVFVSAFTGNEDSDFKIFFETIKKMWLQANLGICFDCCYGPDTKIVKNYEPGYDEFNFNPSYVQKLLGLMGVERYLIDKATSSRFFTVYAYKKPQLFERMDEVPV